MRPWLTALVICAAALFAPAPSTARTLASERENIDRTFELSRGARVEVSSISGSVEVVVTESSTAEVHVTRSARSRAELDCAPMIVEGSPTRLVIRVDQS